MIWLVQEDAVTCRLAASAVFAVLLYATVWLWHAEMTRKNPKSKLWWKIKVIALAVAVGCFEVAAITCFAGAVVATRNHSGQSPEAK